MTFVKGRMPEMLGTNISSTKPFYDKVRLGLLPYYYFVAGNQLRVLLAILTNINITGTSTSTPTTVANAAPDCKPKREIAIATANSKKLLAPIIPAGAATSWGNFHHFAQPQRRISEPFATQAELQSIRYAGDCSVSFLLEMKTG